MPSWICIAIAICADLFGGVSLNNKPIVCPVRQLWEELGAQQNIIMVNVKYTPICNYDTKQNTLLLMHLNRQTLVVIKNLIYIYSMYNKIILFLDWQRIA